MVVSEILSNVLLQYDLILHPLEYFQGFLGGSTKYNPVLTTLQFEIGGDSVSGIWKNLLPCLLSHNSVRLLESLEELGLITVQLYMDIVFVR